MISPRVSRGWVVAAAMVLCACSGLLRAAPDVQVPLDLGGRITVIDPSLEAKLGLFPDYAGFREARLYRIGDGDFQLEVVFGGTDGVLRDRISMSSTATGEFRSRVTALIARQAPQAMIDQEGRTKFVNGMRVFAAGWYGWNVPLALGVINRPAVSTGLYLITAGGGFFVPFWATRNAMVSQGQAELGLCGAGSGIAHALMLNIASTGGEDLHPQGVGAASLALSLGEMAAGYWWAGREGLPGGTGRTMSVMSAFGLAGGLAGASLVDPFDDRSRMWGWAGLAGSVAGLGAGNLLARAQPYSIADADLLALTGIVGAYAVPSFLYVAGIGHDKSLTMGALSGAAAGVAAGHLLTSSRDLDGNQVLLIGLGSVSGGSVGLGTTYLIRGRNGAAGAYLASGAAGALVGFAAAWYGVVDRPSQGRGADLRITPGLVPATADGRVFPVPTLALEASF